MLSVNQIPIILRAAAALRSTKNSEHETLANELTEMVIAAETMRAAAAGARLAKAGQGHRGAPRLPFAIVVNPGETIVCHGAKATAARLAKVLASLGATRATPAHTTLGVAISRHGQWHHAIETDNGLVSVSVVRWHESCTPANPVPK